MGVREVLARLGSKCLCSHSKKACHVFLCSLLFLHTSCQFAVVTFGFAELEHTFSEGEASPQVCVTLGDGEVIVRPSIPAVAFVTAIPGTALGG